MISMVEGGDGATRVTLGMGGNAILKPAGEGVVVGIPGTSMRVMRYTGKGGGLRTLGILDVIM